MRGFNVIESTPGTVSVVSRRTRSILSGPLSPAIYLDGTRLTSNGGGFPFLYEMSTWEIERISFVATPDVTQGVAGAGGIIRIWTRKTPLYAKEISERKKTFIDTSQGFDLPKKFYTPKYLYASSLFEYSGAIHWEPQLRIDANGKATFNILDTGIDRISLYIEGMAEDGKLISTIKTITISEKSNP
jgi:hypothetical protein